MDDGGRPSRVHVHVKRLFMGENGLDWRNPPPNVVAAADKINGLLEKKGWSRDATNSSSEFVRQIPLSDSRCLKKNQNQAIAYRCCETR